ncbi:hypothetical protein O0I10_005972 [Lichtheimia ornata]|uniref:Mannosyltransferase n=1 Tax=Lichtheimia ornata TaxID=688661 RepID=A0AAD7V3P0_9FUNG|nr:uncharacterized protein O0I10_005972 [Lichtheimia ornata]KAJ8658289.1 hypothetical protein O0I10_005972 [Lichtheimia ornata]
MTTDHPDLRHRASSSTLQPKEEAIDDKKDPHVILGRQQSTHTSKLFVLGLCLIHRLVNAFFTRTYDNPDEYWQAQEVAHHMVFGYPFFLLHYLYQRHHQSRLYNP